MAFTVADVARQEVIGVAMPARRQLALEVEAVHPRKPQVEHGVPTAIRPIALAS